MTAAGDPFRPDELEALFARFFEKLPVERAALAVSGGSDSTALMVLFADWLAQIGRRQDDFTVLTVDHGLRPQSATEAREVGARAAALGFRHAILAWEGAKPSSGLQAAARSARYRLIADYTRAHDISLVLTGHTADDQAETLLMRLARGSGLGGLSAMAPLTDLAVRDVDGAYALKLGRPLLEIPKARLCAALQQRGMTWLEDPSNRHLAFERTRLRAARGQLDALGLTTDMVALSARRLQRARGAIEGWVATVCADRSQVAVDPCGVIRIDAPALRVLPTEIAVRLLAWAVAACGGSDEPAPLAGVESIVEALCTGAAPRTWTLARAKIAATAAEITLEREPGREPLPTIMLPPDAQAVWDGRFLVKAGPCLDEGVEVRPLAVDGVRQVRGSVELPRGVSADALRALPGFWRAERLIAVPSLGFWPEEGRRGEFSAAFLGLGNYNSTLAEEPGSP